MALADIEHDKIQSDENGDSKSTSDEGRVGKSCFGYKFDMFAVLLFASAGTASIHLASEFQSGFYLDFLRNNNINTNIGTVCLSVQLITMGLGPYLFGLLPHRVTRSPFMLRISVALVLNALLTAVPACLDMAVGRGEDVVLGIVFVYRACHGLVGGVLYVMVQGEIVDRYLSNHRILMVILCSTFYIGYIIATVAGTELYIAGGWLYSALGIAAINFIPVIMLPVLYRAENNLQTRDRNCEVVVNVEALDVAGEREITERKQTTLSGARSVAFYLPDAALALNNIIYMSMFYVLPARMVKYGIEDLSNAVLFLTILVAVSFVFAAFLGVLADKVDPIFVMAGGSFCFHVGMFIVYGSTTESLSFPHGYKLGYALAGLGDPAFTSLTIMSKFSLFTRWGVDRTGVGERAAKVYNMVFMVSSALGIAISSLTLSRESEIPTLSLIGIFSAAVMVCYGACKLVK